MTTAIALTTAVLAGIAADVSTSTSSTRVGQTFALLDEPGALTVLIRPDGFLGSLSHQHVIEARGYRGEVFYDPTHHKPCHVEVEVPVSGLVVDRPELRKEVGFEKGISEDQRKTVRENMLKPDQLFVDRHTSIRFRSTGCRPLEGRPGIYVLTGDLEIRGVAQTIQIGVKVRLTEGLLHASSDFTEVHENFGFKPYSGLLGTIKNDRRIQFRVRARARRQE